VLRARACQFAQWELSDMHGMMLNALPAWTCFVRQHLCRCVARRPSGSCRRCMHAAACMMNQVTLRLQHKRWTVDERRACSQTLLQTAHVSTEVALSCSRGVAGRRQPETLSGWAAAHWDCS
jgi:hypothetical protein